MSNDESRRGGKPEPGGQKKGLFDKVWGYFRSTELFKSIYRHDYPYNRKTRVMAVMNNLFLHLHPNRVTRYSIDFRYTFGLGGLSFAMFLMLTITGIFLMFYYVPAVPDAYFSIRALGTDVFLGQFFRNLHRWLAHTMVIVVTLHMFRVFYTGGYKGTRKFNWVIGVVLFVLTLVLSFTGYLLPFDQLAYWAITVGVQIGQASPIIGDQVRFLLLGGHDISQNTLVRWYTLHVLFLPVIAFWLMLLHFWRVRKDGFSATHPIPVEDHAILGPVEKPETTKTGRA